MNLILFHKEHLLHWNHFIYAQLLLKTSKCLYGRSICMSGGVYRHWSTVLHSKELILKQYEIMNLSFEYPSGNCSSKETNMETGNVHLINIPSVRKFKTNGIYWKRILMVIALNISVCAKVTWYFHEKNSSIVLCLRYLTMVHCQFSISS